MGKWFWTSIFGTDRNLENRGETRSVVVIVVYAKHRYTKDQRIAELY